MYTDKNGNLEEEQHHWQIKCSQSSNTPEELWDQAVSYFQWCEDHPIKPKRLISAGKLAGTETEITRPRPYTLEGLCIHCGIDYKYIDSLRQMKDTASEWAAVMTRIMMVIKTQNLEYAMIGEFNPIMTAKILNIETKEEVPQDVKVEIVGGMPPLLEDESQISLHSIPKKADLNNGDDEFTGGQ